MENDGEMVCEDKGTRRGGGSFFAIRLLLMTIVHDDLHIHQQEIQEQNTDRQNHGVQQKRTRKDIE